MYFAHRHHREGRKATTVNRARHALTTFFKFLRRQGLVATNPVEDTYALPKPQRVPKYLTISEQERVLAAFAAKRHPTGRRTYALIATALLCGVRASELASVRVTDLDLDAGTLTVIGKGDRERICTVVPRLRAILSHYLTRTWPKLVGSQHGSPYLFVRSGFRHIARRRGQAPLLTRSIHWILKKQISPIVGRPGASAHAPAFVRESAPGEWRAARVDPGGARARQYRDHAHIRACQHEQATGGHRAVSGRRRVMATPRRSDRPRLLLSNREDR